MDTGPEVQGRHIDIYMWSCHEALAARPAASMAITVLRLGWNPKASTPTLVDRLFRQREAVQPPPPPAPRPSRPIETVASRVAEPRSRRANVTRRTESRDSLNRRRSATSTPFSGSVDGSVSWLVLRTQSPLPLLILDTAADTACSRCRAAPAAPGGVPDSRSSPLCRTRILSMSWIVDSRCAIAIVVRPAISTCSASRISSSVSVSTLDVASSRTRIARVERERAGERQQLLLADRQRGAALGDRRCRSRPAAASMKRSACTAAAARCTAVVGDRGVAEPDVAGDRAGEQVHVLQHEAEQRRAAPAGPCRGCRRRRRGCGRCVHVVEPQQQVDERRLARPRSRRRCRRARPAAPRTTRRAGPGRVVVVGERDVVEDDVARRSAVSAAPGRARRGAGRRRTARPATRSSPACRAA